jgi:Arc/MetJ family transcription regulator
VRTLARSAVSFPSQRQERKCRKEELLTVSEQKCETVHMKRTSLMLDEQLLEEAQRLGGDRTYSATVNRALEDFVRRVKARRILELRGSGLWQGELSEMRRDSPVEES